ncbi:MAG: 50S ribosomal protein L9 [Anaerolineae bacterium]|nr:50S ribosomal protein L9 [Anaerolineae bacterium]
MKVILLDYVFKHGVAGEVIDVADGFARNYLIPSGLAVKATPAEMKRATRLREQAAARRAALENQLNELARQIDGVELVFSRRAAITGKLFGSVTSQEIADSLMEETGVDINRRRIGHQPLRETGTHEVLVRLGNETDPTIKVTIVAEQDMAAWLAERDEAEGAREDDESAGEETVEAVDTAEIVDGETIS